MKLMSLFCFVIPLFFGCASLVGGDLIVIVKGFIPMTESEKHHGNCILFAILSDTKERKGAMEHIAAPDFTGMMMVVVTGIKRPYYFVSECQDGRIFYSKEVLIGGPGRVNFTYDNPLDIGELHENH